MPTEQRLTEKGTAAGADRERLPGGRLDLRRVASAGESGRRGFHPLHFFKIIGKSGNKVSMTVNILWPFVPVAFAMHYGIHNNFWGWITAFIGMIPCANLLGFAGEELARKMPKVLGVVVENLFGSLVELIVLLILIVNKHDSEETRIFLVKDAILGSILANLLLCLGLCFFIGGIRWDEQEFHGIVSEVGNGLMLVAGLLLIIPAAFARSITTEDEHHVLDISRAVSFLLLFGFVLYIIFQMGTHHSIYDEVLEADEARDADGHHDRAKPKLTFTEAVFAVAASITLVTFMAYILVRGIETMVQERGLSESFVGLILVPLVEKAAEHLTAIDEAWDNQMNFALIKVLGSSVQTALFNTPIVVFVAWGQHIPMDLEFEIFHCVMLIMAILVVGSVLRDGKSNYLEGFLCVLTYVAIAIVAFWYPNPHHGGAETTSSSEGAAH